MWLAFYNPNAVGDVLMLTNHEDTHALNVETKDDLTVVRSKDTNTLLSINISQASEKFDLKQHEPGQIMMDELLITEILAYLKEAGIRETIEFMAEPAFVVGYVEECVPMKDSDHLSITQTNVGEETLQIVCGASNISANQKVIVAKPGAVMPDGMIIWPGELRGTPSYGMICSTRELELDELSDSEGIWVLSDEFEVGTPLEVVVEKLS